MPENDFELSDAVFARANPNPKRVGCLSPKVLGELARRARPISDPAYDHLAECSPCYVRFRELQKARQRSLTMAYAAAAAVAILLLGAWVFWRARPKVVQLASLPERINRVGKVLDYRLFAPSRGDGVEGPLEPPAARRAAEPLAIILPVGAEPGSYELQVLDSALKPQLSTRGEALLREGATTIAVRLDLSSFAKGTYTLGVRRGDGEWQFFPLRVE